MAAWETRCREAAAEGVPAPARPLLMNSNLESVEVGLAWASWASWGAASCWELERRRLPHVLSAPALPGSEQIAGQPRRPSACPQPADPCRPVQEVVATSALPERIRPVLLGFGTLADGFQPFQLPGGRQAQLRMCSVVMKAVQGRAAKLGQPLQACAGERPGCSLPPPALLPPELRRGCSCRPLVCWPCGRDPLARARPTSSAPQSSWATTPAWPRCSWTRGCRGRRRRA